MMVYPTTAPLSIAPMVDRTHRHFRAFFRCLTKRTLLYTEMLTTGAILRGDPERILGFSSFEGPVALQVGGDDPERLARCAELAEQYGYSEVNLNVGCPSPRVQKGRFGAMLMAEPEVVAAGVVAMRSACSLPVTVKHRIGIDDLDRYEDMLNFVDVVAQAGAHRFTVHARKAILSGLSPKKNREIPPLRYDDVYRLKAERSHLPIEINGGFKSLEHAQEQLRSVDAVMVGRASTDEPWIFSKADSMFFGLDDPVSTRREAVMAHFDYLKEWQDRGVKLPFLLAPMANLFAGQRNARLWRRTLSENARQPGATAELLLETLDRMQ
jgi:tRNA-dihydrouridine synthase A